MNKKLRKRSSTLPQPHTSATATPANTNKMLSTVKRKCKRSSGRLGKRKARKARIKGLDAIDFLHNKTLLSTSSEITGEKLPPPPGCVDYQFTSLTAIAADTVPIHSELPPATSDTSYALQVLLNLYKEQLQIMVTHMKTNEFKENVDQQIVKEKERNLKLSLRLEQLERQVNSLIEDSVWSLKARMSELGIENGFSASDLMLKAKEIMFKHHELQGETVKLQNEIPQLERENAELLDKYACQAAIPSSTVLPEVHEVSPQHGEVLTPAAKKLAYIQLREENMKKYSPVYHNETSERVYKNGHHHKSSKKSHKTKRKSHKHVEPHYTNAESPRRKYDEVDARVDDHLQISFQNNTMLATSGYSTSPHAVPVFRDSFEDIITSTLNEDNSSFYTSEREPHTWACKKEEINSNTDLVNKNQTHCETDETCDNFKADQSDYRKVPPLKLALKRHLSRESKSYRSDMMKTTVGDLVNSEIERSLEISNNGAPKPAPFHSPNSASSTPQYDSTETHFQRHFKKSKKTKYYVDDTPDLLTNFQIILPKEEENSYPNSNHKTIKEEPVENLGERLEVSLTSYSMSLSRTPNWNVNMSPYSLQHEMKTKSNGDSPYYPQQSPSTNRYQHVSSLNEGTDNNWQEVSLGLDRIVEFVSTKLDTKEGLTEKRSIGKSYTRGLRKSSPGKQNSKPPPLHRADSPSEYEGLFERRSSLRSSIAPALPYSPAPLEGPFSPVSQFSPPFLQPDLVSDIALGSEVNEKYCFNEKFRPKGKGWKWR